MGSGLAAFLLAGYFVVKLTVAKESPPPPTGSPPAAPAEARSVKNDPSEESDTSLDWQLPRESLQLACQNEQPIYFVNRGESPAEWDQLPAYWNKFTETVRDPKTGAKVKRKVVKIKVPLGLNRNPSVPAENPMTVARWALGKRLYFDPVLSSNNQVSCASCHAPGKGYTDQAAVSTGINGSQGGISAPTVLNAAYNHFQFWDGRGPSLEGQAQGPPQNDLEMFDGHGNAWHKVVERVRRLGDYPQRFQEAFGTEPTRDAIAKAIACYERTVLSGNSIHDRADLARRRRDHATLEVRDYETVLREAIARKDVPALEALGIDATKDENQVPLLAGRLHHGRTLFFGKARCHLCHGGDNFTDNQFHNLGVGITKDGQVPVGGEGRFARLPMGQKDPTLLGAFKTPTLRGLVKTAPYLHDGSKATLENVVSFYDRGGNANEFLDPLMRDLRAEQAHETSRLNKTPNEASDVLLAGKEQKPIVPLSLGLSLQERKDLVLFLQALQGDPVDPLVADRERMPR